MSRRRNPNPVGPLEYDPATNRYSGLALVRGDILRSAKNGVLYSLDRANGFMLTVTELKDYGKGYLDRSNVDRSFSVDPGVKKGPWAFVKLYHLGRNVFDERMPSEALPNPGRRSRRRNPGVARLDVIRDLRGGQQWVAYLNGGEDASPLGYRRAEAMLEADAIANDIVRRGEADVVSIYVRGVFRATVPAGRRQHESWDEYRLVRPPRGRR